MHALLLALLVWVLVSYGIGALWVWGHRARPEAELTAVDLASEDAKRLAG